MERDDLTDAVGMDSRPEDDLAEKVAAVPELPETARLSPELEAAAHQARAVWLDPCIAAILQLSPRTPRALAESRSDVDRAIAALREEINTSLDPHERLQTIVIVRDSWTVENGLLTPTMKLKRGAIEEAYAPHVEGWYASAQAVIRSD